MTSVEEIKVVLFQMGPTKALGPDGMNVLFYKKIWHIVDNDMTNAILDFLNSGNMVPRFNYTHIVLIPKIKSPQKILDFRPISLCNVIYKNHIKNHSKSPQKKILPKLVSESQSVFMSNHLISHNILVAFETLHHLKNKR